MMYGSPTTTHGRFVLLLLIVVTSWSLCSSNHHGAFFMAGDDHPMSRVTRSLQAKADVVVPKLPNNTVANVCRKYNELLAGVMNCACARHGTNGKQIDCVFDGPQCDDAGFCYAGRIREYLDVNNTSRAKETCSTYSTTGDAETCILVRPRTLGNYTALERCEAKYSPTGVDAAPCHSCTVCPQEEQPTGEPNSVVDAAAETTTTGMLKISLNCCNLVPDLKQTCSPINDGLALPWFAAVQAGQEGQCTSGAAATQRIVIALLGLLLGSFWLLWF